MIASRASRMEAGRFQNGTHVSSWLVQAHVRDTVDQCDARGRPDQTEHRPQRSGLASTISPMKPVIVPGGTSKLRSSTAVTLPNRLVRP